MQPQFVLCNNMFSDFQSRYRQYRINLRTRKLILSKYLGHVHSGHQGETFKENSESKEIFRGSF